MVQDALKPKKTSSIPFPYKQSAGTSQLSALVVTSTWRIAIYLEIRQETPGFITCDNLSNKVWTVTCYVHELNTDSHAVVSVPVAILGTVCWQTWCFIRSLLTLVWQLPTEIPTFSAVVCTVWWWSECTTSSTFSHFPHSMSQNAQAGSSLPVAVLLYSLLTWNWSCHI